MRIAISGTPGTGKSLVGRLLAKQLGCRCIEVGALARRRRLVSGYDRRRRTWIVDLPQLRDAVDDLEDRNLVLVGHIAHSLRAHAVIILRCEIGELRRRLQKRHWSRRKVDENVQAEIFDICAEEAPGALQIDTTHRTPTGVVREIRLRVGI